MLIVHPMRLREASFRSPLSRVVLSEVSELLVPVVVSEDVVYQGSSISSIIDCPLSQSLSLSTGIKAVLPKLIV